MLQISYIAATASSERRSALAVTIPPSFTTAPSINGTVTVGTPVSYTPGGVTGTTPFTVTQQWKANGVNISGATGATYTPVTADGNKQLSVQQTDSNSAGSASDPSSAVFINPLPVSGGITPTSSLIASVSFASQSGNLEFGSEFPLVNTIADTINGGFTGGMTTVIAGSGGTPQRFGKILDPNGGGFPCIRHAVRSDDTLSVNTPDAHRTDVDLGNWPGINNLGTMWFAVNGYLPNGVYGVSGMHIVIFDLHGSSDGGFYTSLQDGIKFNWQVVRSSEVDPPVGYTNYDLSSSFSAGVWTKMVWRAHMDQSGATSLSEFWKDGVLLVNTTEQNGVNGEFPYYPKMACYDGNVQLPAAGAWWCYTSVMVTLDPNQQFTEPQIRGSLV